MDILRLLIEIIGVIGYFILMMALLVGGFCLLLG